MQSFRANFYCFIKSVNQIVDSFMPFKLTIFGKQFLSVSQSLHWICRYNSCFKCCAWVVYRANVWKIEWKSKMHWCGNCDAVVLDLHIQQQLCTNGESLQLYSNWWLIIKSEWFPIFNRKRGEQKEKKNTQILWQCRMFGTCVFNRMKSSISQNKLNCS